MVVSPQASPTPNTVSLKRISEGKMRPRSRPRDSPQDGTASAVGDEAALQPAVSFLGISVRQGLRNTLLSEKPGCGVVGTVYAPNGARFLYALGVCMKT